MEEGKKTEQIKQMLEERSEKDTTKPTALADELKEAKKYYAEKGSTVKVKSVFAKDGFYYPDDEEIYKLKHDFIVEITGVAVEKQDADFQSYLKDVAKKFDEKLNGNINDSLFLGLVSAYPELLSKSDLKWMVDNVKGKKEKFASLCDFILCYINPEKEPNACDKDTITDDEILKRFNFIWEIFKAIKSYGESWAKIGETYLDSLFGDDYVSFEIFTTKFFKKRRAKSFISEVNKYAAKYLKGGRFDLHSTEIYDHYRQVKKAEKKRNLIVAIASLVAVAALGAGSIAFIKSIDKSTVEFHGDKSIVLGYTYGDAPDLKDWYITYKTRDGVEHTEKVDIKMISGIKEDKIGVQQTVTITFGGKTVQIQIRIDAAVLGAPSITRAGTDVTWEAIPNATGYEIYVTKNEITTPDRSALKGTVEQGRTSFNVADVCDSGKSNVYVRAIYTDGNDDETDNKYKNSALSNGVSVEKLGAVSGVDYDGTKLSWQTVDKADKYDVSIDGAPAVEASSASYPVTLKGGETVVITARSNNPDNLYAQSAQFTVLEAPSVRYEGNAISWSGGSEYNVTITNKNGNPIKTVSKTTETKAELNLTDGEKNLYVARVQAAGNGSYISSPLKVAKFAVGYDISVKTEANGTQKISWDKDGLEGSKFRLTIDGNAKPEISANEFPVGDDFSEEGDHTVSVEAIDGDVTVNLKTVTIKKLSAPKLEYDKTKSEWTTISATEGQSVKYKVDGVEVSADELPTTFNEGAVYTVTAWIESTNKNEINSKEASVTVYRLKKPTISVSYSGLNETLTYKGEDPGYTLSCFDTSGKSFRLSDNLEARVLYRIMGQLSAGESNTYDYILDSAPSVAITIEKYVKPATPSYDKTTGALTVGGASDGYTFYYYDNGKQVVLENGSAKNLTTGSYQIYAVQNGGYDEAYPKYFVKSAESDPVQVDKANIVFTVTCYERSGATIVQVNFSENSNLEPYSYVIIFKNSVGAEITRKSSKTNVRDKELKVQTREANCDDIASVEVQITMNNVMESGTWEK